MVSLGTLEEITDLRSVWPHEAHDFTPWLAKNIGVLSDTVGIDISIEETEKSASRAGPSEKKSSSCLTP